ncbi:MAG: hypothetical protein K9J30_08640 [Bacteroidales bacterium]|nr:hypothetical protein [Bacteroidales bacterium]
MYIFDYDQKSVIPLFRSESDIDILVKFKRTPSLLDMVKIHNELSLQIRKKIDIVTEPSKSFGVPRSSLSVPRSSFRMNKLAEPRVEGQLTSNAFGNVRSSHRDHYVVLRLVTR